MSKIRLAARLVGFLLLGVGAAPALAADEPAHTYAVIVGIDRYADPQILPRPHAEADAKALYDLATSEDYLGANPKNVRLLLGAPDGQRPSDRATRANILAALKWLGQTATKDDLCLVAVIGQGAPLGERSCYFAADSTFKNRAKDAVASGDIMHDLDKLKSQRFLALVDVHFLGFNSGKEPAPEPNHTNFYREFYGAEDAKGNNPSRVLFLANSGLKPSLHLQDHGIFTQVLLDGLKGKADQEGYEPDGAITIGELVKYVRKELPNLARTHGKTDDEKGQQPLIVEGQASDFVVGHNPAVFPRARARLEKFDKMIQDQKLPKELAEEGHNFLSRMPKLEGQQKLRQAYQKFVDGGLELAALQNERQAILRDMQIDEADARYFAKMVLHAATVVRQDYVKEANAGQLVESAVSGLYKHLNEKMPSTIRDQLKNAKDLKEDDLRKLLVEARTHLGKREDLANGQDITYALHSMLSKLDRHTDYIDPETLVRMKVEISGRFTGIGVQIRRNNTRDQLQVVTPIKGSPAFKAGIKAGDIITTIVREEGSDGKPLPAAEVLPTKGMTTEEAVKKILGREGTKVKLILERQGEEKPITVELIRAFVEVETVLGNKRNPDASWDYVIDPENKICYVRLTQFSETSYRDLNRVMRELHKKVGIKGFVLDLRFNPGGLLDTAVKICDLFIDDGLIVTIRPRKGQEISYLGKSDGSYTTFPMVCLINGGSASASEIVSACLQDHHRAIVVGWRSYGKGSVQTIHGFPTGGKLKLTTATFWRPNGKNLNRASTSGRDDDEWGVSPDAGFAVKLSAKELNDLQDQQRDQEIIRGPNARPSTESKNGFQDRQLEAAVKYLREQINLARTAQKNQQ